MEYVVMYFDKEFCLSEKETDRYAIYQVNRETNKMRCYYQANGKEVISYKDDYWFNYERTDKERTISYEEVFALCL